MQKIKEKRNNNEPQNIESTLLKQKKLNNLPALQTNMVEVTF